MAIMLISLLSLSEDDAVVEDVVVAELLDDAVVVDELVDVFSSESSSDCNVLATSLTEVLVLV